MGSSTTSNITNNSEFVLFMVVVAIGMTILSVLIMRIHVLITREHIHFTKELCDVYTRMSAHLGIMDMALIPKATKVEAQYTNQASNMKERCGLCTHFSVSDHNGSGTCDKVVGIININGWCKYFQRKFGKAA